MFPCCPADECSALGHTFEEAVLRADTSHVCSEASRKSGVGAKGTARSCSG